MTATTNRGFDMPAHGGAVDAWDTPIVTAFADLDTMLGAVLTTAVSSSPVSLTSTAYKYGVLKFTGTLAGNVVVTLPAKACLYTIDNRTTGASYYLQLTTGSGEAIGIEQGAVVDIMCDGTNLRFRNMPSPGTIEDWGDASMPVWVGACTVPPWLLCDANTFLIATHPVLAAKLGTVWGGDGVTTSATPNLLNRVRASLKSSSPLLTSTYGPNGAARGFGGSESSTLTTGQIPSHYHAAGIYDPTHSHVETIDKTSPQVDGYNSVRGSGYASTPGDAQTSTKAAATGVRVNSLNGLDTTGSTGGGGAHSNVQPTAIHGITVIKT